MSKKFEEAKALSGVSEFHSLFELPVLDAPVIPSIDRCKLRISLLQEELDELKDAIESNDIVAAADAFSDIQYVLSGAILEFGLGAKFADLFAEVQKSKNTESSIVEREGQYLLYRKSDLKVLKSINYYAADFDKILKS